MGRKSKILKRGGRGREGGREGEMVVVIKRLHNTQNKKIKSELVGIVVLLPTAPGCLRPWSQAAMQTSFLAKNVSFIVGVVGFLFGFVFGVAGKYGGKCECSNLNF